MNDWIVPIAFIICLPFCYITGNTLANWATGEGHEVGPVETLITVLTIMSMVVAGFGVFT